jgi:hypothetical protein
MEAEMGRYVIAMSQFFEVTVKFWPVSVAVD